MPISRVRSVTDTNMMFMMPTPPMASVSTPMNVSTTLRPWVMPLIVAMFSTESLMLMARSSAASKRYFLPSSSRTWRSARSCCSGFIVWKTSVAR